MDPLGYEGFLNPTAPILITGHTGFLGRHVAAWALAAGGGGRVHGLARHARGVRGVEEHVGDIRDGAVFRRVLGCVRPGALFHLAGAMPMSGKNGVENAGDYYALNCRATAELFEAVGEVCPRCRIVVSGSSGIYGQPVDGARPIDEGTPLAPPTLYAVTKAVQDDLAAAYARHRGLAVVRARIFNVTGPGEPASFVAGQIARQIVGIERGGRPPEVVLRTLRPSRDFCDVRDVARALGLLMEKGEAGEAYHVCSGRSRTIGEIATLLTSFSSSAPVAIRAEEAEAVPILAQTGDNRKLRERTGWEPEYSIERSLRDLLEACRNE